MFDNINTLHDVESVITFNGKIPSFNEDNKIPELQLQGVTALCKMLKGNEPKHKYAYLADEVGMGKTYQAIGVISMLLHENDKAKILVIAPNRNVQNNWISEINNFQNNNLKKDVKIRVKSFEERENFLNGFTESHDENVFVTRLTTFSTISDSIYRYKNSHYAELKEYPTKEILEGLGRVTNTDAVSILPNNNEFSGPYDSTNAGKICGKYLRNTTPDFDLVIVDEAQNLRNENNATFFLNYWLGLSRWNNEDSTVGKLLKLIDKKENGKDRKETKFLLLSATPAHRNVDSLRNQLLFFEGDTVRAAKDFDQEFLRDFLIRRLRTYNNENKYKIRNIYTKDISENLEKDEEEGLKQRLLLALVQSKLAKNEGKNNKPYKIGFLETLESYGKIKPKQHQNEAVDDEETGETGKEYENDNSPLASERGPAPDKDMITAIRESYNIEFEGADFLPHPKFNWTENEIKKIIDNNLPFKKENTKDIEKALIFVRRLATVDELEERLNKEYEQQVCSYWEKEYPLDNNELRTLQKKFEEEYTGKKDRPEDDENEILNEEDIDDSSGDEGEVSDNNASVANDGKKTKRKVISELLKWIAIKKTHNEKDFNAVSMFKKTLLKNKTNSYLFSENYYAAVHGTENIKELVDDNLTQEINDYIASDLSRYKVGTKEKPKYNYSDLLPLCCYVALKRDKNTDLAEFIRKFYEIKEPTKGSKETFKRDLIIKTLSQDSLWNHMDEYGIDLNLNNCDFYKREALKAITEKYLKSSEAVLELMYCYIKFEKNLCEEIMKRLFSSKCSHGIRIRKLFENGSLVYKQVLGGSEIEVEKKLKIKLQELNLQQWVMPATGGNKGNPGLIKRFNTPFYPDVIVCTDVLKEGINLHLFCNRIYHYGLPWTPGDLEQRIGRIDRFFSKTHRDRLNQLDTKIQVNYPYLGKSVDEYQLKQVLKFKISSDPLLDSRIMNNKDIKIDIDEITVDELAQAVPEEVDDTPYDGREFWGDSESSI